MSTTAMMIRPMRTMACFLPVTPGVAGRRRQLIPVPAPHRTQVVRN
jgi:hypothetical protein